jgi:hypothetical protein
LSVHKATRSNRLPAWLLSAIEYVFRLGKHLIPWFFGIVAGASWLIGYLPEDFRDSIPLVRDSFGSRFVTLLVVGIIWAGYRIFVEYQSKIRSLESATAQKPQLSVKLSGKNRVNDSTMQLVTRRLPKPELSAIESEARATAEKTFIQKCEEAHSERSKAEYPGIMYLPDCKDEDQYAREVDEYVAELREYRAEKYKFDLAQMYAREVNLVVSNEGDFAARDVFLKIELPPNWRTATDEEIDWVNGVGEPIVPEPPEALYLPFSPPYVPAIEDGPIYQPDAVQPDSRRPSISVREGRTIVNYSIGNVPADHEVSDLVPFYLMIVDPNGHIEDFVVRVTAEGLSRAIKHPIDFFVISNR